jgi:hypothetical protein
MIEEQIQELKALCPEARVIAEAGITYLLLPSLKLPPGATPAVVDGLLCPQQHTGYSTRLFISKPVVGKGTNWTTARLVERMWHTPSWQGIGADLRLVEMVLGHLEVYR